MQPYLDGMLTDDEVAEAREHLEALPAVREALPVRGGLRHFVRVATDEPMSPGLRERLAEHPHPRLRRLRGALAAGAVAAAVAIGHAQGATPRPVRVVVVGDSIAAALAYQPSMERAIAKGFDVEVRPPGLSSPRKRRLPLQRRRPVLGSRRRPGRRPHVLGDVLAVDVGYNDNPTVYGRQMADVIRTAKAGGVKQYVWVNLRETEPGFAQINAVIRPEAQRFPLVQVADWSSWSDGKPWFRSDRLHLADTGADGLALMLRVYIVSAARAAPATP